MEEASPMTAPVVVFLVCTAFVVCVLIGYPVVLGLQARLGTRPVRKRPLVTSVSVLLPVHNGEPWLKAKLESLLALDYPRDQIEILVVSDGSTDRTVEIASAYVSQGIRILAVPRGGKAAALNAALAEARGEILLFTDVRQHLEPAALRELVACFADPEVGVASGELILVSGSSGGAPVGLYWKYEKWIRKHLAAIDSFHGATGAIYAMRRELARPVPVDTLLDDVYLPLGAFFAGYRVVFEERARAFDRVTALEDEFRRKVRTLAGVLQIVRLYPALLGPTRNRMWFHFVSHKLFRMLLPWALLAMAVSSLWLPEGWRVAAWSMQGTLYGLALLDPLVPQWLPGKALSSFSRTFVVLMTATLCSVAILVVPPRKLWTPAHHNTRGMSATGSR
jgi:cellulose synthase/poly-beta-1,6-N-acetylglucosamine synthase-like glycosyltransferase